ncbi:serine carboxypeptidase [Earliella scabrosa]|nr:serine carboxypeptidase [Earliella scabrosa]
MMFLRLLLLQVVNLAVATAAKWLQQQEVFATPRYHVGVFTPFEDLHALPTSSYTTLQHPSFPAHSVRIKESHFCDGETRAYTGYIDIEARHLFFYFFESRRDHDTDDVVFWTNGGPGASSSMGLFMELGPCRVIPTGNSTERFEQAWNDYANVFFIDQPIGVGFSYSEYSEQVSNTLEAAEDIAAFVAIFFDHFSKFKGRAFHMAGESQGGRYLPVFASAVYDQNAKLIAAGMTPINLSSVMIGNGCTDTDGMVLSYYNLQCENRGFPEVTTISECVRMKELVPKCQKRIQQSCKDKLDHIDCSAALKFCEDSFSLFMTRVNPWDALRPCTSNPDIMSCYPIIQDTVAYLNRPEVQAQIGVDPSHTNFSVVNYEMNARFYNAGEHFIYRAEDYLAALLERGVRVLVFVGATDWTCNWVGNERMTLDLEWTSREAFREQPLRDWFVDGEVAGKTRRFGGLTFATIRDAGHLAPYDQPVRSSALANRWLAGEDL